MIIKPPIPIPYEVSQIHHIYDIDVLNELEMEEYIVEIAHLINSVDLVV
jgi:DNA polymerase III epsilon subunit-like protein